MKTTRFFLIAFTLASCCVGNRKCQQDNHSVILRMVDKLNGNDLVFGPGSMYNKNAIAFYSLIATDTVFHHYGPGANMEPGQDSVLYVTFDALRPGAVFMRLNSVDTDTMIVNYPIVDASPCCPDYTIARVISVNNIAVENTNRGVTIIKK